MLVKSEESCNGKKKRDSNLVIETSTLKTSNIEKTLHIGQARGFKRND